MSIAELRQQRRTRSNQSMPLPSSKRGDIRRAREREARRIEGDATYHLNRIVTEIAASGVQDISVIQREYSQEVEDVIRAAANNAYIAGVNYVGDTKEMQHAMYLTTPDIAKVKALTAEFTEIFWRRVAAILHKKDVIHSILSARFSFRSPLTWTNLVTSFVARLVTKGIAQGTLTKVRTLDKPAAGGTRGRRPLGIFSFRSAADDSQTESDDNTDPPAPLDTTATDPGQDDRVDSSGTAVTVMQWLTQEDNKVCPICQELEGQQWASDDPQMPQPPDDTHENCRCRLEIVPYDELMS